MLNLICLIMQQKKDIKKISNVDTSSFTLKLNLASLKTEVDILGIDELKILPNSLRNLKKKQIN